jgi:SAM-dependent methyltransferase
MPDPLVPLAVRNYGKFADRYAALVPTKPHNALYERPATLSLLPDVRGLRVLDAGCGPGLYAEWLAQRGAFVVAIDAVPRMVELARERTLGLRVEVQLANLEEPLDRLPDASFDIALAPLVLDYIRNWRHVFGEFRRLLADLGDGTGWISFHRLWRTTPLCGVLSPTDGRGFQLGD